jgi:putative endonuclease
VPRGSKSRGILLSMTAHAARIPPSEWTDPRQVRGLRGELVALAYLVSCGWVIEAHRYRLGRHDLDLIIRRHNVVAFVEVKTRRSLRYGAPVESIGWKKRRTIARVAAVWALRNGRWGDSFRFDVVEVLDLSGRPPEVHHIPDAWRLDK